MKTIVSVIVLLRVMISLGFAETGQAAGHGAQDPLLAVTFGRNDHHFVGVGRAGGTLVSQDGQIWKPALPSSAARLRHVIQVGELYVSVGEQGAIFTSTNALDWRRRDSGLTGTLHG